MESSMKLLSGQIDQEYQNIIQIAQHMTSAGAVGKQLNKMFSAESIFDLSEQKRVFDSILQTVTAVGHQVELAMYYDQSANEIYATNFSVKKTFSLTDELNILKQTPHITFHATHTSQSRFSNHPVLSISWPSVYSNDKVLTIYVEVRTSIPALLADLNRKNTGDYILFQLSESGQLCYCSDPNFTDLEEVEQIIASKDNSGSSTHLMWNKILSKYSFNYKLLSGA